MNRNAVLLAYCPKQHLVSTCAPLEPSTSLCCPIPWDPISKSHHTTPEWKESCKFPFSWNSWQNVIWTSQDRWSWQMCSRSLRIIINISFYCWKLFTVLKKTLYWYWQLTDCRDPCKDIIWFSSSCKIGCISDASCCGVVDNSIWTISVPFWGHLFSPVQTIWWLCVWLLTQQRWSLSGQVSVSSAISHGAKISEPVWQSCHLSGYLHFQNLGHLQQVRMIFGWILFTLILLQCTQLPLFQTQKQTNTTTWPKVSYHVDQQFHIETDFDIDW